MLHANTIIIIYSHDQGSSQLHSQPSGQYLSLSTPFPSQSARLQQLQTKHTPLHWFQLLRHTCTASLIFQSVLSTPFVTYLSRKTDLPPCRVARQHSPQCYCYTALTTASCSGQTIFRNTPFTFTAMLHSHSHSPTTQHSHSLPADLELLPYETSPANALRMRLAYSYAVRLIRCTCDEDEAFGSGPRQITDGYNRSCMSDLHTVQTEVTRSR
jgi:hypothetical protein